MSRAAEVVRRKGDHRRVWIVVGVALFVLLIALPSGLWLMATSLAAADLRQALQDLESSGEPLSWAEFGSLERTEPLPEAWLELVDRYSTRRPLDLAKHSDGKLPELTHAFDTRGEGYLFPSPTDQAKLVERYAQWLESVEEPLGVALDALDVMRHTGPLEWSSYNPGNYIQLVTDLTRALVIRSLVASQRDDPEAALASLILLFRMAEKQGAPTRTRGLMGLNLRLAVLEPALEQLDLFLDDFPDFDASPVLPHLVDYVPATIEAFRQERAGLLEALGLVEDGQLIEDPAQRSTHIPELALLDDWDLSLYLQTLERTIESLRTSTPFATTAARGPGGMTLPFARSDSRLMPARVVRRYGEQALRLQARVDGLRSEIESR